MESWGIESSGLGMHVEGPVAILVYSASHFLSSGYMPNSVKEYDEKFSPEIIGKFLVSYPL